MKLVDQIIQSMKIIGGDVKLKDLYEDLILRKVNLNYVDKNSFEGSVRGTLQSYSRGSSRFNGINKFIQVSKGVWRLNDIKIEIERIASPEKINVFVDTKDDEMFAISKSRVFFRSSDQHEFPGIMVGDRSSLRMEIDKKNYVSIYFTDQKNREWNIGFQLEKDYIISLLDNLISEYDVIS